MKNCLLRLLSMGACAWIGATAGAADLEGHLSKTFVVEPGGTLVIEADRGPIEIRTGEHNEVAIEVKRTVKGGSREKAEQLLAAHEVTFDQEGKQVKVKGTLKKSFSTRNLFGREPQLHVRYSVSVPVKFNLNLQTSAGDIVCASIEGGVKARTSAGSLKFGTVTGSFDGRTAAGGIALEGATGVVNVQTSGGSIDLGKLDAEATVQTSAGGIKIKSAKGKLSALTHGGGIEAGELGGPAELKTSAGSIKVKSAAESLVADTSGGSIAIEDARGPVTAHTSAGSIKVRFTGQPEEACRLSTSGGGIDVTLSETLGFDVEATASAGKITTEIPISTTTTGEFPNRSLKGKLNGGGKLLSLKTSAGNIAIRKP